MVPRPLSATGKRRSASLTSGEGDFPDGVRFKVRFVFFLRPNKKTSLKLFFQGENIILLQLDLPTRTTRDYEGPMVSPMIQAAIDNAMKDEENIELNAKFGGKFLFGAKKNSSVFFLAKSFRIVERRKSSFFFLQEKILFIFVSFFL